MPPRLITVTYTLHPSPPPNSTASSSKSPLITALEGIRAQTPLTNLHWKPSNRTSIRTIQSADISLIELGELGTLGKEVAGSVLEWPLTNLCLITCDSDEAYKNQTKSFIRDWLSLLSARRNAHAPLIVLVNSSTAASGKNVFGRDKGVIAKLRADFNNGKRDRCVQLNLPPDGKDDPAVWVEVINKLKESIVFALDHAMIEREEDIKRGEAQRLTVGWNFCTWFLLKESLAHSFEGVGLNEDALVIYEELEAAFLQVVKEQNLSWFGKLGATGPRDDSLPILDTTAKSYRDMLLTSSISIFDFRVYVFARQAQLLGKLGRITEVAKRGQWFVASLTRRLRENEADLADYFIEAWTYTASMDIVQKCDEWSRIDRPNGDYSGLIAYESARSELLDIARTQVERIGVLVDHLPNEYPFAPAIVPTIAGEDVLFESSDNGLSDGPGVETPPQKASLSNRQLVDAINDKRNFQALFSTLTKRAIAAYEACNKANSVIRLKADLAALALLKEDWSAAYDLCRILARECADQHIWEPASQFALAGALRAHRHLKLEKHEDWLNLALAFLRTCAIADGNGATEEEMEYVVDGLREADILHKVEWHRAFEIALEGETAGWTKEPDVTSNSASVENNLPIPIRVDQVEMGFLDVQGEPVSFFAHDVTLQSGRNTISLLSTTAVQGVFKLVQSKIKFGKVVFSYLAEEESSSIKIHRNPDGPRTDLKMPRDIALDNDPVVILEVHAGEVSMQDIRIALFSDQQEVEYQLHLATCDGAALRTIDQEIVLDRLARGGKTEIVVPYSGSTTLEWATSRAVLRYTNQAGEHRVAIDQHQVSLNLPLTVNVQDFFRQDCLLSHFTIASDGREQLRVESVALEEGAQGAYAVESARKDWSVPTIITPSQPLSCLFKIQKRRTEAAAALRLVIRYRGLEEELEAACSKAIGTDRRWIQASAQALRERKQWIQEYMTTGQAGPAFEQTLRASLPKAMLGDLGTFIKNVNATLTANDDTAWRTLEIPVDVPLRRLLTTVRYEHTTSGSVYEGRAIRLSVVFRSSFEWLGEAADDLKMRKREVMWDIMVSQEDWVVLGRKKGHFALDTDQTTTQEIVLVPVRPGNLFLPTVNVSLLPLDPGIRGLGVGSVQKEDQGIVCETHVENAARYVEVLPACKSRMVVVPVQPAEAWEV